MRLMITRIKELWHNITQKSLRSLYELLFGNETRKGLLIHLAYFFILLCLIFICKRGGFSFWPDLLATVAAFLISAIFVYLSRLLLQSFEDKQKVNYDDSFMEKLYGALPEGQEGEAEAGYHRQFKLGDDICQVYYDCCLDVSSFTDEFSAEIKDDPEKKFELNQFVRENSLEILKAHENSNFNNWDTLRLDGYEIKDNHLVIKTSRSNYISHMLTNRAVDFKIADQISLRKLFEYRDKLSTLESSVFSNHLGMIGMIVLNNGYTLFPHRGNSSTISKNMITSGVAKPMLLKKNPDRSLSSGPIKVPFEDFMLNALPDAMKISADSLSRYDVSIRFLGFGRDVYEGGKPSFFYLINVDMSVNDYFQCHKDFVESDKTTKVDHNKKVYVVKYDSIRWHKRGSFLSFFYLKSPDGKLKEKYIQPEKNLLCNLYHYNRFLNNIGQSE